MDDDGKVIHPGTDVTHPFEFQTRMFEKGAGAIQEQIILIDEILFKVKASSVSVNELDKLKRYGKGLIAPSLNTLYLYPAVHQLPAVGRLWLLNNMGQAAINR